jgi:hypothetical protein
MAYTTVPSVSTGDYWTAAQQNTYLKGNMDFIATTPSIQLPIHSMHAPIDDGIMAAPSSPSAMETYGVNFGSVFVSLVYAGANEGIGWSVILPTGFGVSPAVKFRYSTNDFGAKNIYWAATINVPNSSTTYSGRGGNYLISAIGANALDANKIIEETIPLVNDGGATGGDLVYVSLIRVALDALDTGSATAELYHAELTWSYLSA